MRIQPTRERLDCAIDRAPLPCWREGYLGGDSHDRATCRQAVRGTDDWAKEGLREADLRAIGSPQHEFPVL
jgi:hypothetical protein